MTWRGSIGDVCVRKRMTALGVAGQDMIAVSLVATDGHVA